jgi:hypothetical protein
LIRIKRTAARPWASNGDLFILTGYETTECWVQLHLINAKS